uniref:Actin interacting protein 3-like C-terminal domain-containing protein n=1 Tax=Oncorhynchus kisutch TaxID=8019 RepID=A0A8C7IS75_ONCKI
CTHTNGIVILYLYIHPHPFPLSPEQTKSNLKVTSPEDSEQLSSRQGPPNGTPTRAQDPKGNGSRTVPRRHTLGGARSSQEILAMQPSDMDKKREAFLEHLKQKYPHHASAIMGHQERLREQSLQGMLSSLHSELDIQRYLLKIQFRSPAHGPSSSIVGEQPEHLSLASLESLDTMSEADAPSAFTRGSRSRASLPVVRSTNQTRDRSLGVLYLQYGDETKQIRMPNEITSGDTIRALFVSAFPQLLTMKMLESPSVAVYVKDDMRNMYYELTDVRNITDHSCLKVYHKDPAQAFSHGPRPTNVDTRMHREMMYASRDGQHPPRHPPMGHPPHHPMQGSLSPTTAHSVPPSPSRIPFGPRPGSIPCSATMPRERISNATPPVRSVSPCPSAILERRDVKPDEDMGGKSHSLVRGGEGLYADPYLLHEGRMGHGPAHGGHPPPGDMVDHGSLAGYHRASIRSTGSYSGPSPTEAMEQPSLYRQKSRKYGDSQLPTLGSKTPPPSPHRMAEVRMIDIHGATPPHGSIPLERSSPVRQAFRKEEVVKSRSNMASPVVLDLQGHGPIPPANDPQTRKRMKAMEQQIASLTGLVQHALLKSPNTSDTNNSLSERPMKTSRQASPVHSSPVLAPKSATPPSESGSTPILPGPTPFQTNLLQCKKNVSDLRLQLHQMRQLQLQNQEALRVQLKRAEQDISLKLAEAMRRLEDPVQRQRVLVEEDRHKYLGLEERVFNQLGELELYVDTLKRETGPAGPHRAVTLKHVEEGAVSLRRVGESLAGLKGEFPALQTRMRAVLRVEVEAVKFLKEEPHKLDSMLKRVKSLTETLSSLRRCATEGLLKGSDPAMCASVKPTPSESSPVTTTTVDSDPPVEPPASPSALPEPQSSSIRSEVVMPSSPMVIHHVQSAPVHMQQSQQSAALLGSTGTASASNSNPSSQGGSPAQQKKTPAAHLELATQAPVNNGSSGTGNLLIEEIHTKSKNRAMSIEVAEKEWEERRQNMGQYNGREFERILNEAQANMMKGIPSLDKPATTKPTTAADKVGKVSSEKAIKSPPPPPPRKTFPTSSSGMTTTRSGEVVYTSRKESASGQVSLPIPRSKSVVLPAALPEDPPPTTIREAPKAVVSPPEKALSEATDQPRHWYEEVDEEASLSPDLPGEEAPPPPDNIAFMITNSKVQALSCGEYQELVNAKRGIQTVTVCGGPGKREMTNTTPGGSAGSQDNGFNNKKPVIIIFDQPMDIRSAYKRLSTVFECEEELESMLAAERIEEEDEETEETERSSGGLQVKVKAPSSALSSSSSSLSRSSSSTPELAELSGDGKPDGKKKFTFKFPKKQLAALSQAIRTGTKTGKKTLQVVVYEDEEESDGTVRQHKEAKRFEIQSRSKPSAAPANKTPKAPAAAVVRREHSDSKGRTDKIRKSTYKTLDSLEQTIKQLETTISEMGPATHPQEKPVRSAASVEPHAGCVLSGENGGLKRSLSLPSKSSLLKVPNVASPTSRMPVPLSAKSRQSPGTTTDKAGKQQKLQDSTQRQFRQANGSTKRAGGDHKTTSPTVPTSKIPAFYPSSGKGSTSQSAPNSDATNPLTLSSSSSSPHTTKSSIPSPHAPRHPGSALSTFSHIPSLSNGSSLKLPTPSHTGKALSFSSQTQNGRAPSSSSSSSSSPSPLSPTPLGPGVKSIRTIHTPSFTSYRPQNGSTGKSCIPTATAAKDST